MQPEFGIPLSKVSPSYLHANSTSHTLAFSAIAELIDNAYDPDVSASELKIDVEEINGMKCLTLVDNGNGLDSDKLLKMLSFGFCEKDVFNNMRGTRAPIGAYGNGFKSGSMRLGKDAMVLTRQRTSMSVGLLSQTYLQAIGAETVLVPIVTWKLPERQTQGDARRVQNNMDAFLNHSVFDTEQELFQEFDKLEQANQATKIIIYNLRRSQSNVIELDLVSDPTDIRCSESQELDLTTIDKTITTVPEFRKSLREYCSILFLTPRTKIYIRGEKVETRLISKSLSKTETDVYNPSWLKRKISITFGFSSSEGHEEEYGIMMYYRNRLIKAYEKVGCQKQAGDQGVGVVGIVQADFLQPIHNKQDFNKDEKYNSLMHALGMKLNDYWNEKTHGISGRETSRQEKWLWAQCDNCLKWRRLPGGIYKKSLPAQWLCKMNPDASHNRCDLEEELECEDEALVKSYEKTYKKAQERKKLTEKILKEEQQILKEREMEKKERDLKEREERLRRREEEKQQRQQQRQPHHVNVPEGAAAKEDIDGKGALQRFQRRELETGKNRREEARKRAEEMVPNLRMKTMRSNSASSPSTSNEPPRKRIALTTESGEMIACFSQPSSQPVPETSDDEGDDYEEGNPVSDGVNPDVRELDAQMDVDQPRSAESAMNESESHNSNSSYDGGSSVRAENGGTSMEELAAELRETRLKLQNTEEELAVATKQAEKGEKAQAKLITLQALVHKLLKIIFPEEETGSAESVDTTITGIIQIWENSDSSS